MYLVSNQEDILRCAAGLRVNRLLLAGPLSTLPRAIVPALSVADIQAVSGDQLRHFPLLIELDDDLTGNRLDRSVELTRVRRFHFRNGEERDRISQVQMRDLRLDHIATEISPQIFAEQSDSLNLERVAVGTALGEQAANRISGAFCGALASLHHHEKSAQALVNLFSPRSIPLLDALARVVTGQDPDGGEASLVAASGRAVLRAVDANERDPATIADFLVQESESLDGNWRGKALRWRDWLQQRLDLETDLVSADLSDPAPGKSVTLRAVTLLLFRKNLSSFLQRSAPGDLIPGPTVAVLAAAIAGFREGLEQIDLSIKAPHVGIIDSMACDAETLQSDSKHSFTSQFELDVGEDGDTASLTFSGNGQLAVRTRFDRPLLIERVAKALEDAGFRITRSGSALRISEGDEHIVVEGGSPAAKIGKAPPTQSGPPRQGSRPAGTKPRSASGTTPPSRPAAELPRELQSTGDAQNAGSGLDVPQPVPKAPSRVAEPLAYAPATDSQGGPEERAPAEQAPMGDLALAGKQDPAAVATADQPEDYAPAVVEATDGADPGTKAAQEVESASIGDGAVADATGADAGSAREPEQPDMYGALPQALNARPSHGKSTRKTPAVRSEATKTAKERAPKQPTTKAPRKKATKKSPPKQPTTKAPRKRAAKKGPPVGPTDV